MAAKEFPNRREISMRTGIDRTVRALAMALLLAPAGVLLADPAPAPATSPAGTIDLILVNGTVLTMSPKGNVAQAVAISGDRIGEAGDARHRPGRADARAGLHRRARARSVRVLGGPRRGFARRRGADPRVLS